MYSKNEAILDFKEKHKMTKKKNKKNNIEAGDLFFQKVETDQPSSRDLIQPLYTTLNLCLMMKTKIKLITIMKQRRVLF